MPDIFVASPKVKKTAPKKEPLSSYSKAKDFKDNEMQAKPYTPPLEKQVHLFSSFCLNPRGIHFKNQEHDEKILLFLRRDLITNFTWLVTTIALLSIPILSFPFVDFSKPISIFPIKYIIIFILFYYLLVFTYIYVNFITWYFNIGLITNIRVMDVDFSNLIYKNIAATKITLIQDISFTQGGVFRTFFDYGDVFVQTSGTLENIEFDATPKPENTVHVIEDLIGRNV